MGLEGFLRELERLLPVKREEPMSLHTTFRIGGPADAFVKVHSAEMLCAVARLAQRWEAPLFVLGAGSNLLVSDRGIRGAVAETWTNSGIPPDRLPARQGNEPVEVEVFSGAPLPRLARQTASAGLAGLEWSVGIPGTVGGAVVNNAGAHGGCTAGVVRSVLIVEGGVERRLPAAELRYGYRTSRFREQWDRKNGVPVVLSAVLRLEPEDAQAIQERIAQHTAYRKASQPSQRSMGSMFKNPGERAAGWLIDQAGLKGRRAGDAQISRVHANFIVNRGHARAADVEELIRLAQEQVARQFGVHLDLEVQRVGEGY